MIARHDPVIKVEYVEAFADKLKGKGEVIVDILEDSYHMGVTKHFFLDENMLRYLNFFLTKIKTKIETNIETEITWTSAALP